MTTGNAQAKRKGGFKNCGTGCLVLAILFAAGAFFAYQGVKAFAVKMVEKYTDPAPVELPKADMPQTERRELFKDVDAFAKSARAGESGAELTLSAQDINALIERSSQWAGTLHVYIEDGHIRGDASIPLEKVSRNGLLKKRWLNGSAVFRVDTVAGRLVIFMDELKIRGKPVPESFMSQLRSRNLAEQALENPKSAEVLQKLESVTVRDDLIVIRVR